MELVVDVIADCLKDTAELVPFLLATYLVIETLERGTSGAVARAISRAGRAGPAVGAALGILPQCGFSAMAATLYAGGVVTVGTLVAVILSTSDELIPVFVARGVPLAHLLSLLAFKAVVGMVVGLVVDAVLRALRRPAETPSQAAETQRPAHAPHDHGPRDGSVWSAVVRDALAHTARVTLFIFLFSIVFGLVIEGVGRGELALLLGRHPVRATLLAGLVGLIPNCGASVTIAELYLDGSLGTGPMVAGLLVSGGVGLLVLFRTNADLRANVRIAALVYGVGVVCGLAIGATGIVF